MNDFNSYHFAFFSPWRYLPAYLSAVGYENVTALGKCGVRRESLYRKHQMKWNIRPSCNGGGVNTCSFKINFWILGLFYLGPQYKLQSVPNPYLIALA